MNECFYTSLVTLNYDNDNERTYSSATFNELDQRVQRAVAAVINHLQRTHNNWKHSENSNLPVYITATEEALTAGHTKPHGPGMLWTNPKDYSGSSEYHQLNPKVTETTWKFWLTAFLFKLTMSGERISKIIPSPINLDTTSSQELVLDEESSSSSQCGHKGSLFFINSLRWWFSGLCSIFTKQPTKIW